MDNNDLKKLWHDAHVSNKENIYDKVSIQKSLSMNHSKSISKVLSDVKLKILLYLSVLIIFYWFNDLCFSISWVEFINEFNNSTGFSRYISCNKNNLRNTQIYNPHQNSR